MPYIVRTRTRSGRSSLRVSLTSPRNLFFFRRAGEGGKLTRVHARAGFLGKAAGNRAVRAAAEN